MIITGKASYRFKGEAALRFLIAAVTAILLPAVLLTTTPVFAESSFYSIRISTNKLPENARKDVETLKKKNIEAFIRKTEIEGKGSWFIVYAGKHQSRSDADMALYLMSSGDESRYYKVEKIEAFPSGTPKEPAGLSPVSGKPEQGGSTYDGKSPVIRKTEPAVPARNGILETWSLKALLSDLLVNHDLILSYNENRKASEQLLSQSRSDYKPAVDLFADGGWEKINREYGNDSDDWRYNSNLRITQLLTDFGKTTGNIGKSEAIVIKSANDLESIRQQILLEGISAYLYIIQARDELKYAKQSEESIKQQTGLEEAMVLKGAGLSSNVLQAKAQLAGAKARYITAEGELETARNRFGSLYKKPVPQEALDLFSPPDLPLVPDSIEQAVDQAFQRNPRIAVLKSEIKAIQKNLQIKKAAYYPRINLFAEGALKENEDGIEGYRNEAAAGVELKCNLYSGGGKTDAVRAAEHQLSSAEYTLESLKRDIEKDVRNSWQKFVTLDATADILQNQADISAAFLDLARKERRLGTRSLLDVLAGETTYINSVSNAVSAKIAKKSAAFELLYAVGILDMNRF